MKCKSCPFYDEFCGLRKVPIDGKCELTEKRIKYLSKAFDEIYQEDKVKLIKPEELEKYIDQNFSNYDFADCSDDDCMHDWFDDFPTIDAEPVVHAHWIEYKHMEDVFMCSNCHRTYSECGNDKYCRSCGAKMDGEDNE